MTKNQKIGIALVAIIIVIGGYYFPTGKTVVERVTERLGAVSTLDGVDNPYTSINGVKQYYYSQPIAATSSVPCSIQNPFNATSTLLNYGITVTANGIGPGTSLLGGQIIDVSTSTSKNFAAGSYGSSSPAFIKAFNAGGGKFSTFWTVNATTTNTRVVGMSPTLASSTDVIIKPGEYVNMVISTTSAGTFSSYWTGTCSGVFQQL